MNKKSRFLSSNFVAIGLAPVLLTRVQRHLWKDSLVEQEKGKKGNNTKSPSLTKDRRRPVITIGFCVHFLRKFFLFSFT
jgi:hypothetical protein